MGVDGRLQETDQGQEQRLQDDAPTGPVPDMLDLYSKFHYIVYKEPDHSTLVGMFFRSSLRVPDSLERTVPSVRKNAMLKRGIAGSKRKKSKLLRVVGPDVSLHIIHSHNSMLILTL